MDRGRRTGGGGGLASGRPCTSSASSPAWTSTPDGWSRARGSWTCATRATRSSWRRCTTARAPTSSSSSTSPPPTTSARPWWSWRAAPPTRCSCRSRSAAASARSADAQAVLDAGADKVSVNSAAVQRPELLTEMAEVFGNQCVVLAIDAKRARGRRGWEVFLAGGRTPTGVEAVGWAREGVERGAGEILLTSMDRDGTNSRLRPRADPRGQRRGRRAGDRLRRRGRAVAPGRRAARRRRRGAGRLDLPLRRASRSRRPSASWPAAGLAVRPPA